MCCKLLTSFDSTFYFTIIRLLTENLFSDAHSYDEYFCQVSFKCLHYVTRYHVTGWTDNGRPDRQPKTQCSPPTIVGRCTTIQGLSRTAFISFFENYRRSQGLQWVHGAHHRARKNWR